MRSQVARRELLDTIHSYNNNITQVTKADSVAFASIVAVKIASTAILMSCTGLPVLTQLLSFIQLCHG
jgi:hypothetical protein